MPVYLYIVRTVTAYHEYRPTLKSLQTMTFNDFVIVVPLGYLTTY